MTALFFKIFNSLFLLIYQVRITGLKFPLVLFDQNKDWFKEHFTVPKVCLEYIHNFNLFEAKVRQSHKLMSWLLWPPNVLKILKTLAESNLDLNEFLHNSILNLLLFFCTNLARKREVNSKENCGGTDLDLVFPC